MRLWKRWVQMGNAALQPVDVKAQVGELTALAVAQFKEFAAVVPKPVRSGSRQARQ